ncbi:MAG TPA: DNA repair protein RecO [Bacteroidia bacterium]|nr:DNA repair protein RecO [Bacteroidia bacterium]
MSSLHKTRGIALRVSDYSETSVIARIYTEQFGMQAYMLKGVKRKKSSVKSTMLQPMTLLALNVYHKPGKWLQHVSEMRSEPKLNTIAFDMGKTSIVFLMSEVISKTIQESESNKKLFGFIFDSVLLLDKQDSAGCFNLSFLLHLTSHLGFFPRENFSAEKKYFNLKEGLFVAQPPAHPHWLNESLSEAFFKLLSTPLEKNSELQFSSSEKKNIQAALLMYYRLHLEGFKGVHSQKILEEVWSIEEPEKV